MDYHDRDNLKEFLVSLYGGKAKRWPMNERMFNLTFELISASSSCTGVMNLVPRPHPYGQAPFKWLRAEARKAFLREISKRKEHYVACLQAAALRKASEFEMAAQGI